MVGWGGYAYVRHAVDQFSQQTELKRTAERKAAETEAKRKAEQAEEQRLANLKTEQERQARADAATEAEVKRKAEEASKRGWLLSRPRKIARPKRRPMRTQDVGRTRLSESGWLLSMQIRSKT